MANQEPVQPQVQTEMQVEITDEIAEGIYSNGTILSSSPHEFVLDFIRHIAKTPKSKVKARIILTPEHGKKLMKALIQTVKRYEHQFGPIKDVEAIEALGVTPTAQA